MSHANTSRRATHLAPRALVAAGLALLLSACGAGGVGDSNPASGFDASTSATQPDRVIILTDAVPSAQPGVAYPAATLVATGGDGPVSWSLAGGGLPRGLALDTDGNLSGTPAAEGFYTFTVEATDGRTADRRTLALAVDAFGLGAVDGLVFGDAWSGRRITLRSAGHRGSVVFQAVVNESGGHFDRVDGVAGTAIYVPGAVGPAGAVDVIRVTDPEGDQFAELELAVTPDPLDGHVARFGTTDVWWIDSTAKTGSHPYASDFHAALARLGLRNPASTDPLGTEADRLCEMVVRLSILRHLNPMFLRESDGTAGPGGLAISFAYDRPGEGYVAPAANTWFDGRANGYSIMALCDQSGHLAAVGYAFGDAVGNPRHEHNAPRGDSELGVFVNYVSESVERSWRLYGDALRREPIGPADVPALKALLHERGDTGGRYELLAYFVRALGVDVATVVAHEVGHSLGLPHTGTYTPGDIMNSTVILGPGADHFFLAEALDLLRLGLPGAGRGGATASKLTVAGTSGGLPVEGVHVCEHCTTGR